MSNGHLRHSRNQPAAAQGASAGADGIQPPQQPPVGDQPAPGGNPEWGGLAPGTKVVPLEDLERAVAERDEFKADLQRLAAEFDNFRKRAAREKVAAASAADEKLLGELLAVLDDFERALEQAGTAAGSALADGIQMVHGRLLGVLHQHGLTEVDTSGQFDPHLHDAVLLQPASGGAKENDILQVAQKGYQLGDRVLRHSKVIVAGPPE
jgi:molecular chaperone GrpE